MDKKILDGTYDFLDQKYYLIKKLGDGANAEVFLGVVQQDTNYENFAIKLFKEITSKGERISSENIRQKFEHEVTMLRSVNHPTSIRIIGEKYNAQVKRRGGTNDRKTYIALEYAENGELFDYIYHPSEGISEKISRYIFREYLLGLKAIHDSGIVHRDLKLDNIMVDRNWKLKIADFGFAKSKQGDFMNFKLKSHKGTYSYMAPEILQNQDKYFYYGEPTDIFSSGVILYALVTCKLPFGREYTDILKAHELLSDMEDFWIRRCTHEIVNNTSIEFKRLINLIFSQDPKQRPSIQEIFNIEWMKQEFPSEEEVFQEFERRKKKVIESKEKSQRVNTGNLENYKANKKSKKAQKVERVHKSGNIDHYDIDINHIKKNEDDNEYNYDEHDMIFNCLGNNNYFIKISGLKLEDALEYLEYYFIEVGDQPPKKIVLNHNLNEVQVEFDLFKDEKIVDYSKFSSEIDNLIIKIEVKVNEETNELVFQFYRVEGEKSDFHFKFESFKTYLQEENK